jgi:multiple sugar transport system substrate-binding protein
MLGLPSARGWFVALGVLAVCGCTSRSTPTPKTSGPTFPGVKIVVAAVGDPAILSTVEAQRGDWTATRQAELTIQRTAVDPRATQDVDVLIFRGDRLGDLIDAGALAVLPESELHPAASEEPEEGTAGQPKSESPADPLQFNGVAPVFDKLVSKYGRDRIGLPYGGSALVLVYHRDAVERDANKQDALKANLAPWPPKTWTQFDAWARFFQGRDWNGDGPADFGVSLALGPDPEGLGDATYLARAASIGMHRDHYSFLFDSETMAPRIDSPPFVKALDGLVGLLNSGPPGMATFDADKAREAFKKGDVALLIDRAERASSWSDGKSIGVAPLPGSERVYDPANKKWEQAEPLNQPYLLPFGGGWLVGVARGSTGARQQAALDFAKYLIEPETSSRVLSDPSFPMLPVRSAQMSQGLLNPRSARGVDARQWADAVSHTLLAARVVPGLRIPAADAYLADLGKARLAAVKGESASAALQAAAKAWANLTQKLGTARQLSHYRRSLHNWAVDAEPPAR